MQIYGLLSFSDDKKMSQVVVYGTDMPDIEFDFNSPF